MNPQDELARVLPQPPASQELPRQQLHKTELLSILGADPRRRGAWRRPAARGWLVPAMAAAAVAAVAVLATTVPSLLGGATSGNSAAHPGPGSDHPAWATSEPSGGGSRLTATRHWSVAAARFDRITISVTRGSVTVAGGSASAAAITARPHYGGQAPILSSQIRDGTLTVTARCPQEPDCQVALALQVPAAVAVRATSDLGDVRVTGLHGSVTASSRQGAVVLTDLTGRVTATDDLGDVTLTDLSGPLTANSALGTISGTGLTAATVALSSQDGDITAAFGVPPAQVTASSQLGDVTLRLPATATYHVIASTQLGSDSVTVPQSTRSPHIIKATSQLGSVTVTS